MTIQTDSKIIYHPMVSDSVTIGMQLTTGTKERLGLCGDVCARQREGQGKGRKEGACFLCSI